MKEEISKTMELFCPDLYMGDFFEEGFKGCRILVIGHQAPATEGEEYKFKNDPEKFKKDYKNNNIEMVKDGFLDEGYKTWDNPLRKKTWQHFINIIYYPNKPKLDSDEVKYFLRSIAFANFLTKPCFSENRMGADNPEYYDCAMTSFKHYLNQAFKNNDKPNVVLVWGAETYRRIKKEINEKDELRNDNNAIIHVLSMKHPIIANQNDTNAEIENLIESLSKFSK